MPELSLEPTAQKHGKPAKVRAAPTAPPKVRRTDVDLRQPRERLEAVHRGGVGESKLGEMPLTIFTVLAAIIVYLHLSKPKGAVVQGNEKSDFGHPGVFTPVQPTVEIPAPLKGGQ